jgi:hypothetical protein
MSFLVPSGLGKRDCRGIDSEIHIGAFNAPVRLPGISSIVGLPSCLMMDAIPSLAPVAKRAL